MCGHRARGAGCSTPSRSATLRSTSWRSRLWPWPPARIAARTRSSIWSPGRPAMEISPRDLRRGGHSGHGGRLPAAGRAGAPADRDAVNKRLRGRRGARLAALTSGGAIPDNANYDVGPGAARRDKGAPSTRTSPSTPRPGTSSSTTPGASDRVETGKVWVEDARGAPPSVPFWFGEAPARTAELSEEVGALREDIAARVRGGERRCPRLPLARGGVRARRGRGPAPPRLRGRGPGRAGRRADGRYGDRRALLRRGRRAAAGGPRALRRARQPRLGHGAAQALLPQLRFRAARRPTMECCCRSARNTRSRSSSTPSRCSTPTASGGAGAGCFASPHVRHPLSLERHPIALPPLLGGAGPALLRM